jgi:putative membrane protein
MNKSSPLYFLGTWHPISLFIFYKYLANTKYILLFDGVICVSHKKGSSIHFFLLFIVILVLIWSLIKPEEGYMVLLMEVLPSVLVLVFLIARYNQFRLTTVSYVIITLLVILTFIGGHYSYSEVPLFTWIKDYFNLQRNHYDRFGHLLKGGMVIVIIEILLRKTVLLKSKTTNFIALCITLAIGAFYEIIEWASTKIGKEGKATKEFLGMQGDIWDAQWDMAFLLVGSIFSLFFTKILYKGLEKLK